MDKKMMQGMVQEMKTMCEKMIGMCDKMMAADSDKKPDKGMYPSMKDMK